jgi:hypothetical protein
MNVNKSGLTHDQLQAKCFEWACKEYYPFVHRRLVAVPNDAAGGNVIKGKQYQALGVTGGVWDMVFFWFGYEYHEYDYDSLSPIISPLSIFWEFKVGTDKLSKDRIVKGKKVFGQTEFRDGLLPLGYKFFIASEECEFQSQFKAIIEPTLNIAKELLNGKEAGHRRSIQ